MKDNFISLLDLLMVAYVLHRALVTFVFLPLAGGFFFGHVALYFVLLILAASGALVCCFFEKRFASWVLSILVALAAVVFWCMGISKVHAYFGWNYFCWSVLPELLFASCAFASWMIRRSESNESRVGENAN